MNVENVDVINLTRCSWPCKEVLCQSNKVLKAIFIGLLILNFQRSKSFAQGKGTHLKHTFQLHIFKLVNVIELLKVQYGINLHECVVKRTKIAWAFKSTQVQIYSILILNEYKVRLHVNHILKTHYKTMTAKKENSIIHACMDNKQAFICIPYKIRIN